MSQCLLIREYFPSNFNPSSSPWVLAQAQSIRLYGYNPLVVSPTPIIPRVVKKRNQSKHSWGEKPSKIVTDYLGVRVLRPGYVKLPNNRFLRYNLWAMSYALSLASKGREFSFIHSHFGHAGIAALPIKKRTKKSIITSFYGFDLGSDLKGLSVGYKALANTGDLFIALSEDMKSDLIKAGFPDSRIIVHHLGVDVTHFAPNTDFPRSGESVTLLVVATFHERKGIHHAVKGYKTVMNENPGLNIKLRIVGDGPYKSHIIDAIGGDERITMVNNFIAKNPRQMILREMQNCDMFMLTSKTMPDGDKEGTPVVLMEAQACGKPCISTYHAGIPEIVLHNRTGLLVKEGDIEGIAQAIFTLSTDTEMRRNFGQNARSHILEYFNHDIQMNKLAKVYDDVSGR
jgi:glycosyltransferase involved in cell wall biosynthesis